MPVNVSTSLVRSTGFTRRARATSLGAVATGSRRRTPRRLRSRGWPKRTGLDHGRQAAAGELQVGDDGTSPCPPVWSALWTAIFVPGAKPPDTIPEGSQRLGVGPRGQARRLPSTGTFAVCPTSPAYGVRDNGTGAEVGSGRKGRHRNSGRHHPGTVGGILSEWWAASSRNDRQVPKNRAPAVAVRPGLLMSRRVIGGWPARQSCNL